MRVLIAFTDNDCSNPFVRELKGGLELAGCQVTWSLKKFWNREGDYEVVHLQWPEYLIAQHHPLIYANFQDLRAVLEYWKKRSTIIITRHNQEPHRRNKNDHYEELYNLVYSYCDGVVHLGAYQIEDFIKKYPRIRYNRVIPHHLYTQSYPNQISHEIAVKKLKIPVGTAVILVFGRIRHQQERELLKEFIKNTKGENYFFLIPSWLPAFKGKGVRAFLRTFYYKLDLLKLNLGNNHICLSDKFVKDEEVQIYFNASDVVVIPRIHSLNSGIVTLSYFFKRAVVGPEESNIGQDLKEFDDPVYKSGDVVSLIKAVENGLKLARQGKGEKNYQLAYQRRSPLLIGKMHKSFYEECLQRNTHVDLANLY